MDEEVEGVGEGEMTGGPLAQADLTGTEETGGVEVVIGVLLIGRFIREKCCWLDRPTTRGEEEEVVARRRLDTVK